MAGLRDDERGFTEANGVAVLIGLTVLVTLTVGVNVLVVGEGNTGPARANFSYEYVESNSALVITHEKGDEFAAGGLLIQGPNEEATWAELSGKNESAMVGSGDIVQISGDNAYGTSVSESTTIRIYDASGEEQRELSRWPPSTESVDPSAALTRSHEPSPHPLMLHTG